MSPPAFIHINHAPPATPLDPCEDNLTFYLSAPAKTDLYANPNPPVSHTFNGPAVCRRIEKSSFVLARVTVEAEWLLQHDQGGLIFIVPAPGNPTPDAANTAAGGPDAFPAFAKAGCEIRDGVPCVGVVGRDMNGWCDWSLVPLVGHTVGTVEGAEVTVEMTRDKSALMIWMLTAGMRYLVRKVPWVFLEDVQGRSIAVEALVGAYAVRPDPENKALGAELEVKFCELNIEAGNDIVSA